MRSIVEIVRVPSARGFIAREFLLLPERVYKGCERWVPMPRPEARQILARRHPFFAPRAVEFLLARRNGEARGTIAVYGVPHRPRTRGSRTAYFHLFDCFDDQEAADALFGAACAWARTQGLRTLEGPVGFGMLGSGILMDHYESRAAMTLSPYNHEYYPRLLEGFGFVKREDIRSFLGEVPDLRLPEKTRRTAETALKRGGYLVAERTGAAELRTWDRETSGRPEAREEAPWQRPAFSTQDLRAWSDPQLTRLVSLRGEPAGILSGFADASQALVRGRPARKNGTPRPERRLLVGGFGMLPRFRGADGSAILFLELERILRSGRFDSVEFTGVPETEEVLPLELKAMGFQPGRQHRIYHYEL